MTSPREDNFQEKAGKAAPAQAAEQSPAQPFPPQKKGKRRSGPPLPIRDGLNPTRARLPEEFAGMTAYDFIHHLVTTQRWQAEDDSVTARFAEGLVVATNGEPFAPDDRLKAGVDVWFYRKPAPEPPVPFEIRIVAEDENLLVVDKPPFLATMPRASHITETALVRLRRSTGIAELVPAHRLDRGTSGIVVFIKNPALRGAYQELFARREVEKHYQALAEFNPQITPGTWWESRLSKTAGEPKTLVLPGEPNAFTRVTGVEVLPADGPFTHHPGPGRGGQGVGDVGVDKQMDTPQLGASWSDVSRGSALGIAERYGVAGPVARYSLAPKTGKTHQLRVHMWQAGVPILGDQVYPDLLPVEAEDFARPLCLQSHAIGFVDPVTGVAREFSVPDFHPDRYL